MRKTIILPILSFVAFSSLLCKEEAKANEDLVCPKTLDIAAYKKAEGKKFRNGDFECVRDYDQGVGAKFTPEETTTHLEKWRLYGSCEYSVTAGGKRTWIALMCEPLEGTEKHRELHERRRVLY